jgi:hypothetical protein
MVPVRDAQGTEQTSTPPENGLKTGARPLATRWLGTNRVSARTDLRRLFRPQLLKRRTGGSRANASSVMMMMRRGTRKPAAQAANKADFTSAACTADTEGERS